MSYNLFNGFHTQYPPHIYEEDREKSAILAVKKFNPDILVLCEADFAFKYLDYKIQNYKRS